MRSSYILAIETTCDETSAAVLKDGKELLSNVIYTQIDLHKKYAGVVPELASRAHAAKVASVVSTALKEKQISDLKASIERREKLLSNENYVNKAPSNIVEADRLKLEEEKKKLEELLK